MGNKFDKIIYPFKTHPVNRILIHKKCEEELRDLLERSGRLAQFRSAYHSRLQFLERYREKAISHKEWFEDLKNQTNLSSMKIKPVLNIRILYLIRSENIYLLCAFSEKSDSSVRNYSSHIPIAQERIKDIEGGI